MRKRFFGRALLIAMRLPVVVLLFLIGKAQSARIVLGRRAVLAGSGAAIAFSSSRAGSAVDRPERSRLLSEIARDGNVAAAIEAIVPLDPAAGSAAGSSALDGAWRCERRLLSEV